MGNGVANTKESSLLRASLHTADQRVQLLLDATGDGLWDWNLVSGETFLSPGYYRLTGYRPEEVTPDFDFFQHLVHPDDWPNVLATMQAHLRGEIPDSIIEYRMITASGAILWIRGRGRVVEWDAQGSPVRMLGLISDISEYKSIEQALHQSEARYRTVVEDQTEIISRVEADGRFIFVNDAYCRFFGKTVSELIGHQWHPVAYPDDLPLIEAKLAELSPAHPVVIVENRVFAANNEIRWMQFVNRALFDKMGQWQEIQSVGRDITRRKQLEEEREALLLENSRLSRKLIRLQDKERTELARELHDELSQELVAIRAHAGAIKRRGCRHLKQAHEDATAIIAAAGRIYDVSHHLMEGLHPLLLDCAGVVEAIRDLTRKWSELHPSIGVRVRAIAHVKSNGNEMRIQLYRIVQECLVNIHKHASASRVRIFLGLRQSEGGHCIRLVVRDNGIGMVTRSAQKGYGLLVMRERARLLGGTFLVYNQPGRGVRIVVDVPLGIDEPCPDGDSG